MRLANSRAGELMTGLKAALKGHDSSRVIARIRRRTAESTPPQASGRAVTVLESEDLAGALAQLLPGQVQSHGVITSNASLVFCGTLLLKPLLSSVHSNRNRIAQVK